MEPTKDRMLELLPVVDRPLTLRRWTKTDTYARAEWPSYPPEYRDFNFALAGASQGGLDRHFLARDQDPARIALAVDHAQQHTMAYCAPHEIAWENRAVGNVGFRIRPEWCNRGYGSHIVRLAGLWCRRCGIQSIRLDVGAANVRAVRCYEKAGMLKTGEFWRADPGLADVDISATQYDALRSHFRIKGGTPQVRFWWMELRTDRASSSRRRSTDGRLSTSCRPDGLVRQPIHRVRGGSMAGIVE
jgi:RimJ/RimL family protein N-acetyltransferase